MNRIGAVILTLVLSVLSNQDSYAQQATPLALKLSISDELRRRYGLDPQECGEFEKSVSEKIASKIAERYWHRFCWQLVAADKNDPALDGEVRIELDRNRRRDNWNMVVGVTRANPPRVQHTFEPVEVLESGELLRNRGPRKDELPDRLAEWLRQHFLSEDKVTQLHTKLKLIPVGEGVPSAPRSSVAPGPHGAVLLPWKDYSQFRWSKFRFECMGQNGFERWLATASGGSIMLGSSEVIDVVHDQALPAQVAPRGEVYLVDFVEKTGPDTGELLMPH
jgi:hypothetical protein